MAEHPPDDGGPLASGPDDQASENRPEEPTVPLSESSGGETATPSGDGSVSPSMEDTGTPAQTTSDHWPGPVPTAGEPDAGTAGQFYPSAWQEAVATAPAGMEASHAPRSVRRTAGRHLREIAETIILALLIFLVVRAVVQNFQVEGSSMQPTLQSSWYLLVNKAAYWEVNVETLSKFVPFIEAGDDPTRYIFGGPHRGDVIVFVAPEQIAGQPERDFIKRVIGLPGDTVEIKDCTVFINGEPLDEPYILGQTNRSEPPVVVPPDHFYVLGDNRDNSRDSRAPDIGMIPKESIIGKAWVTYWPFDVLGFIDDTSVEPGGGVSEDQPKSASSQGIAACTG